VARSWFPDRLTVRFASVAGRTEAARFFVLEAERSSSAAATVTRTFRSPGIVLVVRAWPGHNECLMVPRGYRCVLTNRTFEYSCFQRCYPRIVFWTRVSREIFLHGFVMTSTSSVSKDTPDTLAKAAHALTHATARASQGGFVYHVLNRR